MRNRIIIVVEGGIVQAAFAEDGNVDIEIVDRDIDDLPEDEYIEAQRNNVRLERQTESMTQVF